MEMPADLSTRWARSGSAARASAVKASVLRAFATDVCVAMPAVVSACAGALRNAPLEKRAMRSLVRMMAVSYTHLDVSKRQVSGWRRERLAQLPAEVPISVRSDWICEILSTNRRNDLIKKKRAHHRHQVGHYWLVDPIDETLAVYRWHTDGYVEVIMASRDERVRAEPFDGVEIKVGALFGDDEED